MLHAKFKKGVMLLMKRTRNLFVLQGTNKEDIQNVFQQLEFKALVRLPSPSITSDDVSQVFLCNKSVLCTETPANYGSPAIRIQVLHSKGPESTPNSDQISMQNGDIAQQFAEIADRHNCDIGDHISNSSGLKGVPTTFDCGYCNYLEERFSSMRTIRTIYQSKHFFAFTTIGQFIPAYLLIIPFAHIMSNAELEPDERQEFLTVLEDIKYILNLTYHPASLLVWENGTGDTGIGKSKDSIVHAHTHVAASQLTLQQIEETLGFTLDSIDFEDLPLYKEHSYMLLEDEKSLSWKICSSDTGKYIPRQFIRQLIADEYGISGEKWNWRKFPYHESRTQTDIDIHQALQKNWLHLPDRIQANTQILMSSF